MKTINKALATRLWIQCGTVMAILLAASAIQSKAQVYTLATGDTSLQINLAASNPGLSDWTIGGVNQLEQQWFYYSIGGGDVNSIDNIAPWSTPTLNGGSTPSLSETYTSNAEVSVTATYTLQSLSTAVAQLGTQVAIQNLSGQTQSFNLYQYSHFSLGGISGGQDVYFANAGFPYTVYQYNPANTGGGFLEETVNAGLGVTVEESAGIYSGTQLGLENGNPSPNFTDPSGVIGTGNVNYGYEFTAILAPNASITVSTLQTVPEPSSLAFISSGMLVLGFFYWRKSTLVKKAAKVLYFNCFFR